MMLDRSQSLAALLRYRALESPDRGYTWLAQGEEAADRLTYAGLDCRARAIAAALSGSVSPGERALLLYPPGLEFVAAFFGCLYAGVIAVPAYPPRSRRADPRLRSIAIDCRPRAVLTTASLLARREALADQVPELASALWLDTATLADRDTEFEPSPGQIAFLQYTSGSTGTPKGVTVTHANLLHNLERIRLAFGQTPESVVVGWLPLFHDMGLIGNVLEPCYVGCECVLMSPAAFLQKPARWLEAIDRFHGTTSGGPNFAYDLCARSIGPEARAKLDLSSWSVAFNGAEPVRRATLDRFAEAFAPYGFRRESFAPCYGLAEATLLVTAARSVPDEPLVSCGALPEGDEVRIVDPESGSTAPDGQVGEIWVSGPSVAAGYWNRPEETRETFGAVSKDGGPYLRTGDLGFVRNGELVVTGRLKDLIVLRGRNLYPQDLELTAEQAHPALRTGGGAAFSIEQRGEESVVVVHEVERRAGSSIMSLGEIADAVRRAVAEEHGVRVADVVLLRAGTIPKTSSGKIRRRECRARYLDGALEALHRSAVAAAASSAGRLLTRCDLLDLDPAERATALTDWLRAEIARRAGMPEEGIGPETVIAAAGLDSLALFDLHGRLAEDLGLALPAASLADLSIAELCVRLLDSEPEGDGAPPLVPGEIPGDHPVSPGQEALWLLEQSASIEGVLHIAGAARLGAEADSAALLRAALALSDRHPALRTTFAESEGELRQRVHASLPPDLAEEVLPAITDLDGTLRREARRRFDLAEGPPIRVRIFVGPDGERVLLLVLHHLVGDFWSLAVLLRDWAALYAGRAGRAEDAGRAPLPDLAFSYTDFVRWQQRRLASPAGERLERYWLDRLRGAPLVLGLPTDRPRPRVASHAGALAGLRLGPELSGRVRELARAHGATLFTTLLAAFEALLGRLTGQADLLVGAPTTTRRDSAFDGVVGYFVNPVVLRADLAGDPPFSAHLEETRRTVAAALEHRDFPFPLLARRLQPVRDPGSPPVFQVMFVLQNAAPGQDPGLSGFAVGQAGSRIEIEGLALEALRLDPGTAQVDLSLSAASAAETGDALVLSCEHDTALFDSVTVGRWLGHLQTLLDAAAACPEARLGDLPLLCEAELHQVRAEWNDTRTPVQEGLCLHSLFLAWAGRRPDAIAAVCEERSLTYGELADRAAILAARLCAAGAGPEALVGICLDEGLERLAAVLGVFLAGGAYLPLDPGHPRERLAYMIEDAGVRVVLTSEGLTGVLPDTVERIFLEKSCLPPGERAAAPAGAGPENLAYVIYTSGSTGRPNGVMVNHRSAVRLVLHAVEAAGLGPRSRVLQSASFSFDASVLETWAALASGGTLYIASKETRLSGDALGDLVRRAGITFALGTPSVLTLLPTGLPALDTFLVGGESCPAELASRWAPPASGLSRLFNCYGPTETTIYTAAASLQGTYRREPPLGRPVANARAYVLDTHGCPLPAGVGGELYIAGDGLARGYLNRPSLTAERFVPDPLGEAGSRLYRTGDLARWLPEGDLEFLGRVDHQVKIRGLRIELGEIETALAALAGIREAVVVVREDAPGDRRLVAYLVGDGDGDTSPGTLRPALRERLPDSMVPTAFVILPSLPLTPTGKIDRKALPAPEWQSTGESHVAPRTPVEEVLAGIWAELLGLDRAGANDHFFDLGGHSLLATRVTSRLRAAFGIEVPLRDLFEAPVLADLAVRIESRFRAGAGHIAPPLVPIAPTRRAGPLPLSFAQQRLWFIDQLEPGDPLYNMPGALRVEGPLDPQVLALCLGEIVRRHEALRTVFAERDGAPVQVIRPAAPFPLPLIDLSGLPEGAREAQALLLVAEEAVRPFDLSRGPLLHGGLLRLDDGDHVLALTLHHIVSDGWSMGIFIQELAALYPEFAGGRPSPLAELPVQYVDFAVWQRSWLQGEALENEISYWRSQLAGLPSRLELPTDRPRPAVQSFRGASRPVRLPAGLVRQAEALGRSAGATLFMVLLAGFEAVLARYSGQEDLAVGSPVAGRNQVECEGLIGFFVNSLVLRGDLSGEPSLRELLGRVRETALAAWLHQDVPFEKLVEELAPERSLAHSPLFQVLFVLQTAPFESLEIGDLRLRRMEGTGTSVKFDLTLALEERDGGMPGVLKYVSDLFDGTTIDRLIVHYERLLAGAVADPDRSLTSLPLLSESELHQMRIEWSSAAASPDVSLVETFESWVDRTPDAIAVITVPAPGEVLSYAELDARANRLAHRLRALDVTIDSRVGLCAERSPAMIVAMLGILKAGAAYVPLDPAYPKERLAFMVEDARIALLLTEERLLGSLPETSAATVLLDTEARCGCEHRLPSLATPDSLAYVIYTSGSTGRPKGAMIHHRGWSNLAYAQRHLLRVKPGDRVLQFASLSFDASASEIAMALGAGATLVLGPRERRLSAADLTALVRTSNIVTLPPTVLAALEPGDLPGLESLIVAGEAFPLDLARRWSAGRRLFNGYGPTEVTIGAAMKLYDGGERLPIGRPLAGMQVHVLDARGNMVPVGVAGELCVGGVGLARGYLGRPDRTAESFVPNPLASLPGERLYRTGDLALHRPDGEIEFLGRLDHQVKVRGFRIELGEIETALAAVPGVREAVVVVREDVSGGRLVAYVTGDAAAGELRHDLRKKLGERLPDYMVPAAFVKLRALPLNPNGKVDRKALPAPEEQDTGESHVAPRTPVEEVLAGIWTELLGLERVGANDHFFDLGGHSLLATRVTSRLRGVFGIEMPLRDLFEAPRLADLAARIEETLRGRPGRPLDPIAATLRTGPLPLSFAQQRLWFIDQLEPGSPLYNVAAALRVEGPLKPEVLALCLGEVVRRHEALRTTFAVSQGLPEQVIRPAVPVVLSVVDLAGLPELAREAQARTVLREEADRPFDLARGPLLRSLLLRLAEGGHIVALTMHHIVSDGWSAGVLVREVAALYPAFAQGRPSPLPELPVQYADFAAWQRSWLQGEILESELSFWRRQLAGLPPRLELPTDHPRPGVQSFRGASRPVRLSAGLTRQMYALGQREGATLYMVLLAGFQALLARYSGQDDLAVGSPIAGRNRVEIEGLIGFFVNTLVLRGDLAGTPTFRELLARVRETALAAYLHQDVPFEKLVEEIAPERSLAHAPLFQVMLVLQNAPVENLEIEDLRLRPASEEAATAKFDLTLAFTERDGGLGGTMEYATDLFDAATIDRLVVHFERFLTAAPEAPERSISELPLLSPAEIHQAIAEWSDTEIPAASGMLLHELLTARAELAPELPALVQGQERLTYGELAARSDRLAAHLRALGTGPDVIVALFLERSIDLVVALLAVLKAGGAYLPLDASLPSSRLSFLLDDSRASLLLTRKRLLPALPGHSSGVACLDDLPEIAGGAGPAVQPAADNLAYVLYTSGSTGNPKGVAVTHRGLANYLLWAAEAYPAGEGRGAPVHSPVGFDLTVTSLFLPLLAGRCVDLVPEENGVEGLASALAEGGFGLVKLTPSHLDVLQRLLPPERVPGCASAFVIGGEALSGEQLAFWRLHAPGLRLINEYGPTETVVGCCAYEIPASMPLAGPVPIGRPIANTRILILDPRMSPVPIGVPGELHIGGAGLCRGYLHRPGLTAGKLIPDPFGTGGERLYRTGDLARRLPDGRIEFLGRTDHQVKIRGFRIELGEIEAALAALPGVREAAVVVREDVAGGRLVAYVTGEVAAGEPRRDFRERLGERLPDYMVPAAFVVLPALPLTPNGKVDRKALPAPEWQSAEESHVAPRTPVEEVLAGIWAELLGLERVGANDHFFELGGHSLLATRVTSRLRSIFGIEMPLRDLFEAPRLADLAVRIEGMRTGTGRPAPPLVPVAYRGSLPLSFAQQRLWFIDQLEPGSPRYNVPAALRVEGPLEPGVLALCLGEIVRRHETLRTTFAASQGFPEQVIQPAAPTVPSLVDLAGLPEPARETQALALTKGEADRPFDLARGPLLRSLLLRLAEGDHIVALTLHHIVSDGWSAGVLVREVAALYPAFAEGRPSPLPELPVQYADFAVWQRSWLQGEVLEGELSFWRRQLAGLPPRLELPTDRPRPAVQSFRGASRRVQLPSGLTRQMYILGRREGATLFMVLLAGFQALLARYSGQDDLAVGSPIAGRNRVEIEGLIGFFVNTLVLRGDLAGSPTFRELLARVRETTLAAHAHQDLPFEKLVEELAPERSLAHAPLFQVMLALQNAPAGNLEIRGLHLRPLSEPRTTAKFDLTLSFEEHGGELAGSVEYASDLFDATTIGRLLAGFERLLAGALADPDWPVADLPLLSESELHQARIEWNPTGAAPEATLVETFESWADRTPDAVAVITVLAPDEVLTYAELDARADRLAHRLRALGVKIDSRVGLCAERSPAMIVAVLGILKAGAAYVPLDPAYPRERLAFLIEDARLSVLLTEERLLGSLPVTAAAIVLLDPDRPEGGSAGRPQGRLLETTTPDGLAYVIYTSGSTGRPKGAMIPHRGWSNLADAQRRLFGLGPGDRIFQFASLGFDASAWEIAMAFGAGATLVLGPRERRLSREELTALLRECTATLLPPTVLATLSPQELPGLETLIVGGEACPVELARAWAAGRRFWNAYGPTEASVAATLMPYDGGERLPIGRPIARMQAHVLDSRGNPVPVEVAGELCLGGPGLARGYLDRPDRTAASFVPNPLATLPGERLYRTGDLARRLPDGSLDYLGRLDHQVKVRGFRIEPGEIEAALAALSGVRQAVVTVREDMPGVRHLVAYVTGESEPEELREQLRERLPEHMVPGVFVRLEALPLTPNGKVDRKALPAPDRQGFSESWQAPRTPVEEVLAGIWGEVLGLERVGAADRFFDLGGHSLLATQVLSRVREAFTVELPLRELFEAPALSDLAARIEEALRAGSGSAAPPLVPIVPLVPIPRESLLPLSFAQERFWFLDRLEPGNPAYNMPGAFELAGRLDVAALAAALGHVASRHEVLRTVFRVEEGVPRQHILPSIRIGLPVLDLSSLPEDVRLAEAKRLLVERSLHRFDLARGPLLDAALLRLEANRHHLVLVLHHAVCDGWSLSLLVREIGEIYAACTAGRPPSLDELRVQYADFAVWQRKRVAASGQAELAWWLDRLTGEIAPLEMPADRMRPIVQTYRGGRASLVLPAARLAAFGRAHGTTLFMTLLAAIKALLHRHSGQDDILVGAPVAGRRAVETEGLIGCFLNTLVLRTDVGGGPGFRELAARVREVTLGAYSHQDVPFEAVLAGLPQQRDLSRTPLFQVMVNLLNLPSTEMRLPGVALASLDEANPLSKFDMTFYVSEGDGVRVELVYNADLFDAARMEDLLAQLDAFLDQALDRPAEPIGAFSLVTEAARAVLPDPAAPLPAVWTGAVHERFAERARQHPDRPAVTDRDGVWTYGELEEAANRLCAWLQGRCVMPGDRVAVYAHRSAPLALALLGTLKAGAAFTILDPAHPAVRLTETLLAAAPRAFLHLKAAGELPGGVEEWLRDTGCPALELPYGGLPGGSTGRFAGPDDPAWVSFTSGSTGVPKGVLGSHRPLSHFISWHGERFGLTGTDRFSLLSGLAHDPLLRDLFTPLCLGALLAIPQPEELTSPGRFAGWMQAQGITVAHLTPALSEVLTEAREVSLETLRLAFFGGDVLTRRAFERLRGMAPGCAVVNYYGATETPQGMGFHEVSLPDRERIPLGRGIDGVQLLVLNDANRLAGVGEPGEICIRTPYLALGYLHDEALTRERFVANPFTGAPDDRMYRTGDLGRYLPDGSVDFQGRRDTQVKLRGFRIELGEIEAALSALPGVSRAVVVVREDTLVAYVVGERRSFRDELRERLPDSMVPGIFVTLDSLPLTPNGKVDRKALPAPDRQGLPESWQAPRTPVEEVLAGIWGEVLGLERVGAADRFFDLGGHSLLATQVLSRVREAFKVELPLRDVFEAPALSELAARIEKAGLGSEAPPLVPVSRDGDLPLSFAQQRLWFIDQLEPGSSLYNMQVALRVEGPLDAAALAHCLMEIVRRHEVLRTVYAAPEGSPVQVVRPAAPFLLPVVDLSGLPERERAALSVSVAEEEAARPFDLACDPVLRGTLLRLTAEDHVVVLTLHHIAGDGWSLGILVHEVTTLYAASPLPELPVQYADFAVWQASWLQGTVLERKISFWRSQLAGLPPLLELPTDRPRPAVQSYRGASRPIRLPAELMGRIRALGGREGATLFMVLLAGFQALLARYSGQQELAVGTPIAGRNRIEIEGLIGFFVNTLVMRGDLAGRPSFQELLGRSRDTALAAYLHQDVPFEKLVQELSPQRSLSHSPLFQVMLTLQNAPLRSHETGNLRVRPVSGAGRTAKFDLELILQERDGGLAGVAEYAADLFDAVTIDRLIVHFEKLLAAALAAPEQGVSELPLLAPSERWQTLQEWNDTSRACPKDASIQELFAEQAARTPHAVAVSFENRRLTYRELDERADRLAQWLIDRGVGMDVLVALLVERSLEMIVALVGILKAGGAYAPLEPGLPPSRLRWLLDDVRSPVLLTQTALLPEVEAAGGFEGPVLRMDGEGLEGTEPGIGGRRLASHPLQLAYVNYTSGSTGRPKGVVVPHLGVTRLVMNPDYMEMGPDDVILQLSTYAWDAATWEIWGALLNGGRLVMIPRETVLDFRRLSRVLVEERITALYLTTSLFNQFVEQEGESLAGLSTLIIGGETASVPHFRKAVEMLPRTRIINEYGPTENTSYSSWQLVRDTPAQGALPIGKPLSNSTVYVLDRGLQPMPPGLAGELFLGGDGLARGYLGRPDLTAERFVPHPFATGERLYRTGDLGAWRPDGTLDFLGRMDFQVKIRGHRIEPAEVEDAIKRHPGVEDAVVLAYEPVPQDRRLVAYVTGDIVVDELRESLRERLPDYMVPASFVTLAALPLSPIGKVDRKALPPPGQQSSSETSYVAPFTHAERALAEIWAELLGVERVGVTDDFFALGGHSLLAVRLMARIEQVFNVRLPLSALFEAPSVRPLAEAILGDPVWRSVLVRLHPGGSRRPVFLVHPAGGDVFSYVDLAKTLGTQRPVYGLQAVAEGGERQPAMEDLAAQYLAAVREVQPEGPWLLAGWSAGAVTAYEMARQTEAAGGAASLVAMIDPPSPPKGREVDLASLLAGFAALGGVHSEQKLEAVREMLEGLDLDAGLDRLIELSRAEGVLPPGVGRPWMQERFDLYSRTERAVAGYVPRPYGGQVILFRASASLAPGATDLTSGWSLLARTEAHLIPDTNHFSLLQMPALHRVVELMESALDSFEG